MRKVRADRWLGLFELKPQRGSPKVKRWSGLWTQRSPSSQPSPGGVETHSQIRSCFLQPWLLMSLPPQFCAKTLGSTSAPLPFVAARFVVTRLDRCASSCSVQFQIECVRKKPEEVRRRCTAYNIPQLILRKTSMSSPCLAPPGGGGSPAAEKRLAASIIPRPWSLIRAGRLPQCRGADDLQEH